MLPSHKAEIQASERAWLLQGHAVWLRQRNVPQEWAVTGLQKQSAVARGFEPGLYSRPALAEGSRQT